MSYVAPCNGEVRVDRLIAIVLLERPVVPDMHAVADAIRSRHPDVPVVDLTQVPATPGQAARGIIQFSSERVVVMSKPAPLPQTTGKGTWSHLAAFIWPDAPAVAE